MLPSPLLRMIREFADDSEQEEKQDREYLKRAKYNYRRSAVFLFGFLTALVMVVYLYYLGKIYHRGDCHGLPIFSGILLYVSSLCQTDVIWYVHAVGTILQMSLGSLSFGLCTDFPFWLYCIHIIALGLTSTFALLGHGITPNRHRHYCLFFYNDEL